MASKWHKRWHKSSTLLGVGCGLWLFLGCSGEGDGPCECPGADSECYEVPSEGAVGDLVGEVSELEVEVFHRVGDGAPKPSDTFLMRVSGDHAYLFFNDGASGNVSPARLDEILTLLYEMPFHYNEECRALAVDGYPRTPRIVVRNPVADYQFSVSDESCAKTDVSRVGNVISCSAYQQLLSLLEEAAGQSVSYPCEAYW